MIKRPNKKIWEKMNERQQKIWVILNDKFNHRELFPPESPTFKCTEKEIECIAHNFALTAVWELAQIFDGGDI